MANQVVPDRFAAIALQPARPNRPELKPIPPLSLPERHFESRVSDGSGAPPPAARMRSVDDMRARVAELFSHYRPFLENHTPPLPVERPRLDLREFSFRFEEAQDRADAQRPYSPAGAWEAVTIPHFRGPVGRWAAYYRRTFNADACLFALGRIFLIFRGVDYRCQVFLNGVYLGSHEGFFAPFELDATGTLREGENTLLVRVENDFPTLSIKSWSEHDLDGDKLYAATGPGWNEPGQGWSHCPPGAGIFQPVYLEARPPVFISDLWVRPDLNHSQAEAWIEVTNTLPENAALRLELSLFARNFHGDAVRGIAPELPEIGPGCNLFKIPLAMRAFQVWQPESPCLYTLRAEIASGGARDARDVAFGMRKFEMDTAQEPKGALRLNGQPIFLRGCNTMGFEQRDVMESRIDRLVEDVLMLKAANMNYLRITQRPVQSEVYEVFDMLGMLHQCDFPLFGYLRYNQIAEAVRQAGEMERLIRRHPSAVMITYINEPFPIQPGTRDSVRMLDRAGLEAFFEAATQVVRVMNPDRVVKAVDGDYDPPAPGLPDEHCYNLWYNNHGIPFGQLHQGWLLPLKPGWKGGCGEYGIEGLDAWETMRDTYPPEWFPASPDQAWDPRLIFGSQTFTMHPKFYDAEETCAGWVKASQRHQAWGFAKMTEAFRRRADIMVSTMVHLSIDAWPAGWLKSIVSVDRRPKQAYFSYADSLTPLAVNLRTDRHQVYGGENLQVEAWVLNDRPTAPQGCQLAWWVELDGRIVFSQRAAAEVPLSGARYQGLIDWQTPPVPDRTQIVVGLALLGPDGRSLHDYHLEITVFPYPDLSHFQSLPAGILGQRGGPAWLLAQTLGMQPLPFAAGGFKLALADHPAAVETAGETIARHLADGGSLFCLEQDADAGAWRVAGREVRWEFLDPCYFASRKTGHPALAGLRPFDLAWWYHPLEKRIEPTFRKIFKGEDLRPLAFSATLVPAGERVSRPEFWAVAAELRVGKGKVIFNQVEAACRAPSEPLAMQYLTKTLGYLLDARSEE